MQLLKSSKPLSLLLATIVSASSVAQALPFEAACEPAQKTLVIGAVGDFLMHAPLQARGYSARFENLWKSVQPRIDQVDVMYGNLETPVAEGVTKARRVIDGSAARFDNNVYSGYPTFNTHENLLDAVKASGFDVLSTANNHSMDRGAIGIDKTVQALEERQMSYTGTRKKGATSSFTTFVKSQGFNLAFISCTFSLNGFTDPHNQVLECYSEKSALLSEIRQAKKTADAVIVTPHWGAEYVNAPGAREVALGKELLEEGALAVIATHPHVIQPIRKHTTRDGREGVIVYSTGNFISSQGGQKKVGLMVFLGLSQNANGTWINGVRYSPTYMGTAVTGLNFLDKSAGSAQFMPLVTSVMKDKAGFLPTGEVLVTNPECH